MSNVNDSLCLERVTGERIEEFLNLSLYYASMNFSREPSFIRQLDGSDYVKVVAYIVIIVGGLLGNISVVLTVALNRSMRTTINYYVANLAVADALICLICMGSHLIITLTTPIYALGSFMCKFNPFMQMTCLTSSVLTLSAISCDRFMAIMFPLHVRITKQRTSIVMCIVWIISLIVSIPFLIVKKHYVFEWNDYEEPSCIEQWPQNAYYSAETNRCETLETYRSVYYLVCSITIYFLPVAIMITAYSLILWKLWISEVPGEASTSNMNVQSRARKKVIKMVLFVLVAFIICWTPLQSIILYSAYSPDSTNTVPWYDDFKWFSYYIAYANSFMNPIIYGGFNKTFREGFCIILRCGFRRNRLNRQRINVPSGVSNHPQKSTRLTKSLRSLVTTVTSISSRTNKFLFQPKTPVPMYQAKVVKATAV